MLREELIVATESQIVLGTIKMPKGTIETIGTITSIGPIDTIATIKNQFYFFITLRVIFAFVVVTLIR